MKGNDRKWLNETVDLDSEKIHSILKSYFDESKISSGLTPIELSNISCLFTSKLLDTPDCVNKKRRVLTYTEIFDILTKVFDLLKLDEKNLDVECYKITQHFHSRNLLNVSK